MTIYDNIKFNQDIVRERKPIFNIHFIEHPFFEVKGTPNEEYIVNFVDRNTGVSHYSSRVFNNTWTMCSIQYYKDWLIDVTRVSTGETFQFTNNLEGKRVFISFESSSLGDNLAWIPYVEEFRKKHNCHVICSTFWNHLFQEEYPKIEFLNRGQSVPNIFACYRLGWFYKDGEPDLNRVPNNFRLGPLQKTATDILGLEWKEIKPKVKMKPGVEKEKVVSIAIHGTSQAKYWNRIGGWQELVNWLKSLGYRVILLSKEDNGYMGNMHPEGVEKLKSGPIESVIEVLQKSTIFIGIGSGLSWLSWATGTPTCIISGFSYAYTEPNGDVIRVETPSGYCTGCFNSERLDAGDWNWCPKLKGSVRQFECTKSIKTKSIQDKIKKILE